MNIDFKLPELGENIESGDIVNVLVRGSDCNCDKRRSAGNRDRQGRCGTPLPLRRQGGQNPREKRTNRQGQANSLDRRIRGRYAGDNSAAKTRRAGRRPGETRKAGCRDTARKAQDTGQSRTAHR